MGHVSQYFDLNHQANSSRKLVKHKIQADGLDAPRKSLEFYKGAWRNYNVIQGDIPYSCQVKRQPSQMNHHSNGYQTKKLINEESSKRMTNNYNNHNVVACLMGMDALLLETKPSICAKQWKDEKPRSGLPRKEPIKLSSIHHTNSLYSASMKKSEQDLLPYDFKRESPFPREHPQEELLQKFKKDFMAWQTAKAWESNKYLQQQKVNQILAQENLNKEKIVRYQESRRHPRQKKLNDPKVCFLKSQSKTYVGQRLNEKQDRACSPPRIVILRPSIERCNAVEGSFHRSSEILDKETNMHDFFEEVKEKLKSEILGKARNNTKALEISKEKPYSERSETKQFARHIAKQIGESVTRDLGTSLISSESNRSYRSEYQSNRSEAKGKKDGFNLKGTVISSLKGKFLGKKTHSVDEMAPDEFYFVNPCANAPSVVTKVCNVLDNSTEVPPSPASVSSCSLDEFFCQDVPSPVSPLQAHFIEEQSAFEVYTESSAIFPEPTDLQPVNPSAFEEVETEEVSIIDEAGKGRAQAYIRYILISAGFYENENFDKLFQTSDASIEPISNCVFEEVEEACRQQAKFNGAESLFSCGHNAKITRKMLFDLTNEVLPHVLKSSTSPKFREWIRGLNRTLKRKNLLNDLWWQIQMCTKTSSDKPNSVNRLVAKGVRMDPWCAMLHEDLYFTGRRIELEIVGDLVDEIVQEMLQLANNPE